MQRIETRRQFTGRARAQAMPVEHGDHRILLFVAYALASAIIVMWMAYLPAVTSSFLSNLNIVPSHLSSVETINRVHKEDRLTRSNFAARWSAVVERAEPLPSAHSADQIPEGCEAAFAGFVKIGNFSARCIASAEASSRLAAVETHAVEERLLG